MVRIVASFAALALAASQPSVGSLSMDEAEAFAANQTRLCQRQRVIKDVRMSRTGLWRRADTVAAGYPLHLQQYVRLLALSLTGSLDLAPKYSWINSKRFCGLDWPTERGFTMRGLVRLKNMAELLLSVVSEKIPGDLAEVGVWRGGGSIFAGAILNELEGRGTSRAFHLFDIFNKQIPLEEPGARVFFAKTTPQHIADYFKMFGVNRNLHFHKGLLNQTLPQFYQKHIKSQLRISVLCIDVKWYDATLDALYYLYSFVPVGGYVVFSTYSAANGEKAWADFKADQQLSEEVTLSDAVGAYFKKTKDVQIDFSTMRTPRDCNL